MPSPVHTRVCVCVCLRVCMCLCVPVCLVGCRWQRVRRTTEAFKSAVVEVIVCYQEYNEIGLGNLGKFKDKNRKSIEVYMRKYLCRFKRCITAMYTDTQTRMISFTLSHTHTHTQTHTQLMEPP